MRRIVTAEIDARPLAAGRITVGLASLFILLEWLVPLHKIASADAFPVPVAGWLPEPSLPLVNAMTVAAILASAGMILGITRWPALAVSAVSGLALLLDQQAYSNHLVLLAVLALFLGLSGSHRVWSLFYRRSGPRVPYWPAFLIQAQVSTLYFWTGMAKVNEQFLSGHVFEVNLRSWAIPPGQLLVVLAVASIVTEVALSVILWVPRLYPLALTVGLGLHGGIIATLSQPAPLVAFAGLMASGYVLFGYRWWQLRSGRAGTDRSAER